MSEYKTKYGSRVSTGIGRLQFAHLSAPDQGQYGNNCYNLTWLTPRDQAPITLKAVKEECIRVAKEAFPDVLDLKTLEWPWKDGEAKSKYEGHAGCIYLRAKAYATKKNGEKNRVPATLDLDGTSHIDPVALYNGCLCRVNVTPKSYTTSEKQVIVKADGSRETVTATTMGVSLLLNGVQFCGDAERFKVGDGGVQFDAVESAASDEEGDDDLPF